MLMASHTVGSQRDAARFKPLWPNPLQGPRAACIESIMTIFMLRSAQRYMSKGDIRVLLVG